MKFLAFNESLQLISYQRNMEKSLGSPAVYNIETTNYCPMTCIMCPRSLMTRKIEHMDPKVFQHIIDQAKNHTECVWLDHFGDPLLNPNIVDMISYAKSRGLRVGFSTNATSLTPDRSKQLIAAKLDLLHISLDGTDQETYSYYRGKNANYELAVTNVEEFISQKLALRSLLPYTTIAMIKMDRTLAQLNTFLSLWSKDGIDKVLIKSFSTMDGSVDSSLSLEHQTMVENSKRCYFPWSSVTILVDGRIVPCCYDFDGKVVLGDVTKDSLSSIWNGEQMKRLRREHILNNFSENSLCRNCVDKRQARGLGFVMRRVENMLRKKNKTENARGFNASDVEFWYM